MTITTVSRMQEYGNNNNNNYHHRIIVIIYIIDTTEIRPDNWIFPTSARDFRYSRINNTKLYLYIEYNIIIVLSQFGR